jgi:polyisoprenoid-binding protein YceI
MATKWKIDSTHSDIQFKVKHLMISTVTGHFETFDLEAETSTGDFSTAGQIVFTADIDSINTKNEDRDAHLKSADFFNAAEHPQLRFEGNKIPGRRR